MEQAVGPLQVGVGQENLLLLAGKLTQAASTMPLPVVA